VKGFQRVLVPVDFSGATSRVIETAASLVAPGGTMRILHVVAWVPSVVEGTLLGYADPKQTQALHAESERKLQEYARASGLPRVDVEVLEGDSAPGILDAARRHASDLIVIATHSRGGLGHLLLGSVAEKVLHETTCPILMLRA
jgi:nucleotide-binding universal stress UspA family protein